MPDQAIINIISSESSVPLESITLESSLDSLGLDSLDVIDISFVIEEKLSFEFGDLSVEIVTVGDLIELVKTELVKNA